MTITTIAAHLEPAAPAALDAALEAPFALAAAQDAELTLFLFPAEGADPALPEDAAAAHVAEAAARRGLRCEVRRRGSLAYGTAEAVVDQLRVSDLGLLALPERPGAGQRQLIGAAVFEGGRPVLLVPAGASLAVPPGRVVIAWDATPAAVRAVHGALPLIRGAAETLIVTVTEGGELRGGRSGVELGRLLARHGVEAGFAAVPRGDRGVLAALAAEAQLRPGALLVMGAVRHSPVRSIVFGSATTDLLDAGAALPVLLAA